MHKILISFFSLLAILATDGLARPLTCRFRSAGKCTDLSYFQTQAKDGCATPGSKCSVAFCTGYCASITKREARNMNKFGTNVVGICSANCLNPQTLHRMPSHKRKALYGVITDSLKQKKTGLRLAQDMEQTLKQYRRNRKKGLFGWFKNNPNRTEQLETLVLEEELRKAYVAEIKKVWKHTKNLKKVTELLRNAATQLEPGAPVERSDLRSDRARSHTSAQTSRRQSALAEEIAVSAGLPQEVAEAIAEQVASDTRKGKTPPPVPAKSPKVRALSQRLSTARAALSSTPDSGMSSRRSSVSSVGAPPPPPPPMPAEGIDAYLARQRQEGPASATGTLATSAASANSVPQYDAVKTSRPTLNTALQDQIKAGKKLRKTSPTPSDSGVSSGSEDEGRGALLDAIRKGKKLRKTTGPTKRVNAPDHIMAGVLARRAAIEDSPESGEEESWDDE